MTSSARLCACLLGILWSRIVDRLLALCPATEERLEDDEGEEHDDYEDHVVHDPGAVLVDLAQPSEALSRRVVLFGERARNGQIRENSKWQRDGRRYKKTYHTVVRR